MIPRRLTILERLRPDNIPHTVPRKHHSPRDLLLRGPRDIRTNHRQAHAESQTLEIAQPKRNQTAPLIGIREAD